MSGFFGLFNRDGTPLHRGSAATMLDSISYWKPDVKGKWDSEFVAVGHSMLWNTPQSKLDKLPCQQAHLTITMDARLDDREGLVEELNLSNCNFETITDSELILKAYEKWAEDCTQHLLGDFAFAIWDSEKQHFFCARDHIGVKQFYYHLTTPFFAFSNDLKALSKHPDIPLKVNDCSIADFLINYHQLSVKNTFFLSIQKLPPAHSLRVSVTSMDINCFWKAEDSPRIKPLINSPELVAEKLKGLIDLAVHDRIRSSYQISSHLSGGLDSGAIAVIAARKLKEKKEKLLTFNWQEEPNNDVDSNHWEWANSSRIATLEGIVHNYVSVTEDDIFQYTQKHTIAYGHSATFWFEYAVREAVHSNNSRTILSGWGGDEIASYHGQAFHSNLFSKMKFKAIFKELKRKIKKSDNSFLIVSLSYFYRNLLLPFSPKMLFQCISPKRQIKMPEYPFVIPSFLATLKNEWHKPTALTAQPERTIRAHMLAYLEHGHLQSRMESWASAATLKNLEYSYPLLDKRIVEFVLGLPPENFVHNGFKRYLFRSAVEKLLPEDIIWAETKMEAMRVKRLLAYKLAACKKILRKKEVVENKSRYINTKKLANYTIEYNSKEMNKDSLMMIVNIEASLLVMQSFTLH